ncbi:MAG: pyridoxal-dependent decarboxylase [Myxococcales bacterium]|nr:pyridoxal-dependent decarboxylase [Myxococcales bacterium]
MDERHPLRRAYDGDHVRALGHAVVDSVVDHLSQSTDRVLPWKPPEEAREAFRRDYPVRGDVQGAMHALRVAIQSSTRLHDGRCLGHQVSAPLPAAAFADGVASLLNNGMGVYEMGPAGVPIEQNVIRFLASRLGFGSEADGILTSGGSLGNLTALLAARQRGAGWNLWQEGTRGGPPLAILVGADAHYSVTRAAKIMGLGASGAVPVALDGERRMDPASLAEAYARCEREGVRPIAVVASACSTAAGAFDPLDAIADFCEPRNLWLHVDGAHGASMVWSQRHRHRVHGIARADSVLWDLHKLMMMPALVSAVIYRNGEDSYLPFHADASYLFEQDPREEWFNLGHRTLECTKRMMALEVDFCLRAYGTEVFEAHVDGVMDLTQTFARMIRTAPHFQLSFEPQANIVCFRYAPGGVVAPCEMQRLLRREVIRRGRYYLVQTRIDGEWHLRSALMNPFTTGDDLQGLLTELLDVAANLPL